MPEQVAAAQANQAWVAWREGDLAERNSGPGALQAWQHSQWTYAFQWMARLPLLAVALDRDQVPEAVEHARALLDLQQQKLPEPLDTAVAAAVAAAGQEAPEVTHGRLARVVQVAQETGYL